MVAYAFLNVTLVKKTVNLQLLRKHAVLERFGRSPSPLSERLRFGAKKKKKDKLGVLDQLKIVTSAWSRWTDASRAISARILRSTDVCSRCQVRAVAANSSAQTRTKKGRTGCNLLLLLTCLDPGRVCITLSGHVVSILHHTLP